MRSAGNAIMRNIASRGFSPPPPQDYTDPGSGLSFDELSALLKPFRETEYNTAEKLERKAKQNLA